MVLLFPIFILEILGSVISHFILEIVYSAISHLYIGGTWFCYFPFNVTSEEGVIPANPTAPPVQHNGSSHVIQAV